MNGIILIAMPGSGEWLFILIFGVIWLWALVDCLKSNFRNDSKLFWALLIVLLPFIGALVYLAIGRSQKLRTVN